MLSTSTGGAAKKREDTHKMAEANKAFCPLQMVVIDASDFCVDKLLAEYGGYYAKTSIT